MVKIKAHFPLYKDDGKISLSLNEQQLVALSKLKNAIDTKTLRLVENPCLCGYDNRQDIIVSEKDRYALPIPQVLCPHCGIIRSKYVFDKESNNKFYECFYRGLYTSDMPTDVFFNSSQVVQGQKFLDLLRKHIPIEEISDVAEVGCGAGGLLLPFKEIGKNVTGYDFDEKYLEYGRSKGLNLIYGDFYKLAKDESCDLILLSHVLEHFLHPFEEMKLLLSKLKINKYIIIEVPGIYCIKSVYSNPIKYFQNAHVYNFYEQYLRVFFEKLGLKVIYGDERCTFICQKIESLNMNINNTIWDASLEKCHKDIAEYILTCKKEYERGPKKTIKQRLYPLACKLGWKKIRPYIKGKSKEK